MIYVLDASAILRFLENEPGALEVERLIKDAVVGSTELLISAANWSEILFIVLKAHGAAVMGNVESRLQSLPLRVIAVDQRNARTAAEFRHKHRIPFADSFAGYLTQEHKATLVTADQDFRSVTTSIKVHFLPNKNNPKTP